MTVRFLLTSSCSMLSDVSSPLVLSGWPLSTPAFVCVAAVGEVAAAAVEVVVVGMGVVEVVVEEAVDASLIAMVEVPRTVGGECAALTLLTLQLHKCCLNRCKIEAVYRRKVNRQIIRVRVLQQLLWVLVSFFNDASQFNYTLINDLHGGYVQHLT